MSAVRDALAARLNVILPVLGCGHVKAMPSDLHRVYAGHWQRSEGAFSWFLHCVGVEIGSQNTMADCVLYPVTISVSVTAWVLDPIKPGDVGQRNVPAGAMFATTREWDGKIGQWYDANGKEIAAR